MTTNNPLISVRELQERMATRPESVLVCDCRSDLVDYELGQKLYSQAHIPGARFVNMNTELSGPKTGRNGRHPLPDKAVFAAALAQWGVNGDTLVVGYDSHGGMYGARLWWLVRRAGHANVAVLDGGLPAWEAAGLPVSAEPFAARPPGNVRQGSPHVTEVDLVNVRAGLGNPARIIVDARPADRFQGQNETLDPRPGHMPGAINRPSKGNVTDAGFFKTTPFFISYIDSSQSARTAHFRYLTGLARAALGDRTNAIEDLRLSVQCDPSRLYPGLELGELVS